MEPKPIRTKAEHEAALVWVEAQFNAGVLPNSPAGRKVQEVLLLIKQFEGAYYLVSPQ